MVRFSDIIDDGHKMNAEKVSRREGVNLRKTGIWNMGKIKGKNTMDEARVYYQQLLTFANKVQSWVQNNETINISPVLHLLQTLIENDLIDSLYYYLVFKDNRQSNTGIHTIELTIFSLKIGIGMGYERKRLLALAIVAFLHDVGMYKINENIVEKKGKLNEREFKEIQRHPTISADLLSTLGSKYTWLANVSSQVHERADGSGYPRGLREGEIHEYAYIIGLVDIYSAMIKDRPYRDRIEKNRAMKSIIASCKGKFPAKIIKVFLNQISFFPVGSHIRLNDRSVGRVITTNPNFPLKPTVEILHDNVGTRLKESRIVDLSRQPLLYITESIDERDLI